MRAPHLRANSPHNFTDENVTAWRPNGTLAWRFRSQQFCVGDRSTFIFAAFFVDHGPRRGGVGVSNVCRDV